MNVKRFLKIDIVYVFHCCALADFPRWIKQSLQQRMEDWKQRSKTLVDQIHVVDPYYIDEYRFIGQVSYADIAAGRTNSPNSRNCSPYRYQREATPPTMTAQVLRPAVMRTQKLTVEYSSPLVEPQISKTQTQENIASLNKSKSQLQTETRVQPMDDRSTISAEQCQQNIPEVIVESSVPRRGRSPTRKTNSSKVKDSTVVDQEEKIDRHDNPRLGTNSIQEAQMEPARKDTLAPREEGRGRSPSPMWVPGSTSYADILRGSIQTTQANTAPAQPPRQKMVSLSGESRRDRVEVPQMEQVAVDIVADVDKSQQVTEIQQVTPTQEIQVENVRIAETYCQSPEISTEKAKDQSYAESEPTNWADETLQEYDVLQRVKSYQNVPTQPQSTKIYDYMIPEAMPELVGFIGSHLGTYPVSSYVYAPTSHHQQVQQLDTINLNPYNNDSLTYAPEHYVEQIAYLSASDIYQQTPMQQPQCPVNDMRHATAMLVEKPVEVPVIRQPEVSKDATEPIDKPEQQKPVNILNVETSTTNKTEGKDTSSNNIEIKGQIFSYAQILSHGLSPCVTSTRVVSELPAANHQSKERSDSPKESLELSSRELSPLQEPKLEQDSQSFVVTLEQSRQSKKNDWDTMKKREVRKRQQQPNDKTKQTDERKSRKPIDKPKEKQKKEKLSPPKQLETQDEPVLDKVSDSPAQKEEKSMHQEKPAIDTNPSQEKKRRQKKKKVDKSGGDEIDKALKEIEDMDKQKTKSQKDKLKEQNKEQNKPRDSINETVEKCKDEADKKQSKSGEKSKKSGKSKEAMRVKETMSMEHTTLSSQFITSDQNIPKDNAEGKEDMKDAKVLDSKDEEKVQTDISKEMVKDQIDNIHINSDKSDSTMKCKNKIDKNIKAKEQRRESPKNKVQDQADVLGNKKNKINIVNENNVTEIIKSAQKIELENTNEKTSTSTKIENTKKHKDASKKEKKTKSKELKMDTKNSNMNQETLEIDTKEIIEAKSLESIKPLIDIEIKNLSSKALDITKIVSEVNENTKSKINFRKKDKTSKSKIKSEVNMSSTIPTSKVLDEIKINLNDTHTEKDDAPKSKVAAEAKIAETAVVEEISKEITLLPKTVQQITQNNVQIDITYKNDKTYDSTGVEKLIESKETEHYQINAKQKELEAENFPRENLETTDTINEKEVINSNKRIEKIGEVDKCQTKTAKQKKSEKMMSNVQDKDKKEEENTEISQLVEDKCIGKKDELNIESLIAPKVEIVVQEKSTEIMNLTDVSVSNNSCFVQSKTDVENKHGVKDEREDKGQVNKRAPETVPKSKKKNKSKDKAVIQSTIHDIKSTENSKLKDVVETAASAIVELVTSINEEVSRNETMKLIKDDDKSEATSAEKPTTVPDLIISTVPENIEITSTTKTFFKEFEVSSEINSTTTNMKEKYQNVKNGKLDHQQEVVIKKDTKTHIDNKDSLMKEQDIEKSKDVASKEKTSKRTKRKERLSPKHIVEQTKQSPSFYDKFQEEIVFEDDSTKRKETPKLTTSPKQEKFKNLSPLAKIDNINIKKTQESPKKDETEFDSKVSSDSINKAQVHEKHINEIHNDNLESEQPSSTGKALIIEKIVTTVTTTSVPGSVKVKSPDVKSVKSVEIIENIPLPKIIGSKVTELITLRPETIEASLTTTYAKVPNDFLVGSYSTQSDQTATAQKVGSTSAISTKNIMISDELALFGSVRDRKRVCPGISENRNMSNKSPIASEEGDLTAQLDDNMERSGDQLKVEVPEEKCKNDNMKKENIIVTSEIIAVDTILQNDNIIESQNINNPVKNDNIVLSNKAIQADSNILLEEKYKRIDGNKSNVIDTIAKDVQEKAVDEKIELEIKCESECAISKIKKKEIPESMKTKKQIVPEYLLDLIKPYAIDRHAYNHAESNFYRYFKVIKIVKEPQQSTVIVQTRPESVERIVQESVMKPVKSVSQETCEVNRDRRHVLIIEAPKYPITSFHEFESQWVKMKFTPEKSVSISSDDSEISIKTAIETGKQTVEEKDAMSDLKEDTTAIKVKKLKTIETIKIIDDEDKDKKSGNLQSVHLVSDDSWMSILDEPMVIEDDFDDISNSEKNTINETVNEELIDVESQDRTNKIQVKEQQLSGVLKVPSCIESVEEIRELAIMSVSTSANNIPTTDVIDSTINTINESSQSIVDITELNVSVESSTEKISDDQLVDAGAITDTNIQADKIVMKNNIETEQDMLEIKTMPTKVSSVHLESDDAWMALLEEEIIIDDNFDELETETVKDDQIKERKKEDEKKKAKIKQRVKEIEDKKPMIEKQEDKVEKKESIIEEQEEKIEKEIKIEKSGEEIEEKKIIKKSKEEIEAKEPKIEITNNTSLTETTVKDEYHTSVKDIQNETSEKQSDRTTNQQKKKKESKHIKVIKTKDQAKIKAAKKQSDIEIKTDAIESDLSLQSNLEEHKILDNETDSKTKEAEKSLTVDKQIESYRNNGESKLLSDESKPKSQDTIDEEYEKPLSKREEHKLKSNKKSKKQNQKSEIPLKETFATTKHESNMKKDDNIVLSKAIEIESNIFESSSIMKKQQESKDVPKYDSRLNPNAKSWAAIVGTRGITETIVVPKDDSLNTQMYVITHQDINDSVTNIVKQSQASTVHDSCEIPSKEETLHSSSLENQISKNVIEELKATMVDEIIKPITEKSTAPPKQFKEGNKSYAQVTASSRRTSSQTSQEETYSIKPIPLKTDHLTIDVKTSISNEVHEDFSTEKLQSPLEQNNKQVDEMVEQSSDYQTIIVNLISQKDSIPWVEEVEKETLVISNTSVSPINIKDNEKLENTWAAIVGKKSIESPEVNDIPNVEQNLSKSEQIMSEQWSPIQIQIYVEEAPKQEPIENLVQVDEQGFMEFVNRKELRSRRSRSRSRSAKRDNRHATEETSNSIKNKEIKTLDMKSDNSENVKAKEEIENETKQSVQKHDDEQKVVDESDELAKIIKEENTKPSKKTHVFKNKDKNKQKNDSNERKNQSKMQLAENEIHNVENKIIQETKPEPDIILKGKKNKSKKNKFGKDYVKQQIEQKELKHIEEPKEDKKSANENETEHNKIQLENIEDQSIKGIQLIKDTEHAQENKYKEYNGEALSIIDQNNATKPKKKKNKKAKLIIEQLNENASDIDKKTVRDFGEKIKLSVESKLDDKVKIKPEEVITTDITCNILIYPEYEETPAEDINKQKENIEQIIIAETTERESFERKIIVDELRNACKESHLEKVEKTVMEKKEILKLTKAEKRKQKKKIKIAQNKSTDLSDDVNIVENIKTEEMVKVTEETIDTAPSKDKIDDVLKKNDESTETQSVQIVEIAKPLKNASENIIENEISLPQITPIKDKQKSKSKSKLKKEKRQDDKIKSQNFTMTLTTDSMEIETPGNIEIINLSKDIVECDTTQPKQKNVEKQVLDNELNEILQSPKDIIDKNDFSVATDTIKQEDTKESPVSPIRKEVDEKPIKIKDSLLSKKKHKQKSLKKQDTKAEDKKEFQLQQDLTKCPKENVISIIDKTVLIANETIHVTSKETDFKTESSLDSTKKEKNNVISIESEEKLEISNEKREEGIKNKLEINEKQIETNDAVKLTISSEKIEINEQIIDQKENVPKGEEASVDNITLTEKIELSQTEETQLKLDDTSKLYDVTGNNDITKIEPVLISDKTKNSEIGMDASTPINDMQIESSCDSINAVIKHSPPSDKLSLVVQQSFEDEDKLKHIASIEQESSDVSMEPPKSKVQFYIADEILVLNPERQKSSIFHRKSIDIPSTSSLQEQLTTDLCSLWFLSIDNSFWLNKRPYHEAERDHFESLALYTKKSLSRNSKRDSDDHHRPRDRDDDNLGGSGGGSRSRDSCGNSHSLGTPQTERMIADLPGGMCSWSDYSTYLSSESERTMDHSLPFGTIEDLTFDSGLSLDSSLPSNGQSSSPEFLSLSAPSHNPQTESRMESLEDAEITPKKYPAVFSSSSFQSSDHPSTCTSSLTFAHLRPQSKLHLGRETREGSVQWCSPNEEVERETAKGEAERRIRRIQVRSPSRPVLGLVLVEFEPSPLPYVYIHVYVYILVVFSYLDCLPLVFRSLCLSFCKTITFFFLVRY